MRKSRQDRQGRAVGWRLIAAVPVFALLSACGPYLADKGWRQSAPGLTEPSSPQQKAVPVSVAGDGKADPALASTDASGVCLIHRLAAGGGDPTDAELQAAFACTRGAVAPAYAESSHVLVREFTAWHRISAAPFFSDALGDRYGVVYANGRALGLESSDEHFDRGFPVGATLAVPTFTLSETGVAEAGPLVLVEKMEPGFFALQGNWRYSIVDTAGRVAAVTRGMNQDAVSVCAECTHSQADLLYASLLNDGVVPYAEGAGPAFPSVDTYGSSGGLVPAKPQDGTGASPILPGAGTVLDPNAPIFDPNIPATDG